MPISVGRSVTLPRAPTDREWEQLVGELRETFHASGKDRSQGDLRQWTNGNLHAYVEPTEDEYRLRLGTRKGNAAALNLIGITGILVGLIMLVSMVAGTEAAVALSGPLIFLLFGASASATTHFPFPAGPRSGRSRWSTSRRAPGL